MCLLDIISIIKDIALAIAACVTGGVAIIGLNTWQRELKGRANFDVARQLAKSMYILRDQITYCRSPITVAQEFPNDYQGGLAKHTNAEEGDAWAHLYKNRWELVGKAVQDFDTASLEAEALWGHDVKVQCTKLRDCVRDLRVDIDMFIKNKYNGGESFKDIGFANRIESGIWDVTSKDKDNELTQRINTTITGIEAFLIPHLSR